MIRVVTLEEFLPEDVAAICTQLYQAFGLGCEPAGALPLPEEAEMKRPKGYEAVLLLQEAETVKLVADDKLLYLMKSPLVQKEGPLGRPPAYGHAEIGGQKAVVSTSHFPKKWKEGSDEFRNRVTKHAMRAIGRCWDLRTCPDPKCAMHPPWAEGYALHEDPVFCNFCREQSEERIRLGTT